jgi:hypothetical protein
MVWQYHGKPIPLETYHGVPRGWHAEEIVREHRKLGGTSSLSGPEATEPGAPSWFPDRNAWLQYREMLYRLGDLAEAGDAACVELVVRYIELHHIGSYSGYVRAKLARRLKKAPLTENQKDRLHSHFRGMVLREDRTLEFEAYLRLWRTIITESRMEKLLRDLRSMQNGEARAEWLEKRLRARCSN